MARPRLPIDPEQVAALAALHCSLAEMAALLGCNPSTLVRRFAEVIKKGRLLARVDLRRAQFDMASGLTFQDQDGRIYTRTPDRTMLVWLGKVVLGQQGEDSESGGGSVDRAESAASLSDQERVLAILLGAQTSPIQPDRRKE